MQEILISRHRLTLLVAEALFLFVGVAAGTQRQPPTQKGAQEALSPQEVFRRVSPSVFVVESLNSAGEVLAFGSAVAIELPQKDSSPDSQASPNIVVVTNKHVIYGATAYRLRKGEKVWKATLVRLDQEHDLCALQPEAGWVAKPMPVRRSSKVNVGERVYAIGTPEGLELTLSEGLVSGLREMENVRVIQTSAAISHGSSGGGLFDTEGRLIGITTFFLKEGQNLNFALPGEWILSLADEASGHFPASASGSQLEEARKWSDKGLSAYLHEQYQEAVDAYKEAVRLDPSDPTTWYRLGDAQKELKRDEEALKSFQESVRLKKNDPLPWQSMTLVYLRLHRFNEAIDPANQVVLLKSDSSTAWAELCAAYLGAKKYEEAVNACQMWTLLEPDKSSAWAVLGVAQRRANQLSEAEVSLKEAINLAPSDAASFYQLGLVYSKQGNQSKVRDIYEILQRLNPSLAEKLLGKLAVR